MVKTEFEGLSWMARRRTYSPGPSERLLQKLSRMLKAVHWRTNDASANLTAAAAGDADVHHGQDARANDALDVDPGRRATKSEGTG